MNKELLIIFYRNPELGKVKTRLAASVGDEKALAIYLRLSGHTREVTENLAMDKSVYYSDFTDSEDNWSLTKYKKEIQTGRDLGERMKNAFASGFEQGYQKIAIIGTDCFELSSEIITQSFERLDHHDAVIGPALDGGYYLLGMKKLIPEIFRNKAWSTESVCTETMKDLERLNLIYSLSPPLRDVDEVRDLPEELAHLLNPNRPA